MSKIYEALLRAELDRASANGKDSDHSSATHSSAQALLDPPLAPTPHAPAPHAPTPHAATPNAPAPQPPSPHAPTFELPAFTREPLAARPGTSLTPSDLERVRRVPWKPSLQQLPALEERGAAVEQFRSLRSRMHEFRDLDTLKSILVSSGLPQEGKSFVAANLAISFARHKNSRVLLIDGDMRRCSLHKMLGTTCEPGLAEFLAGKASAPEIMQRAAPPEPGAPLHPGLASLTFIAGGNDGDKAADLSGNRRFDDLIASVAPLFDWIVVDSSPVNLVADGVNLARACDGVLLIARGAVTKFETAQRALSELKASRILGFVLNAVHNPPASGGYYGYDGYDSVKA